MSLVGICWSLRCLPLRTASCGWHKVGKDELCFFATLSWAALTCCNQAIFENVVPSPVLTG